MGDLIIGLYEHPYAVSTAVRSADAAIAKMHRSMKDVALAESSEQIDATAQVVDEQEKIALEHLNRAREQFLGDKESFDVLIEEFGHGC